MKEIIFITGLARTGSTLLDLILGGHPRFVGLGEVFQLIRSDLDWLDRTSEVQCSCGNTLGYEELALYPKFLVHDICKFLGVQVVDLMFSLLDSGSHSVLGNRMRSSMEKRQGIFYDNRWFYRNEVLLPSVLFPNIMRYNAKEVYRNVRGLLWNK